MSAIRELSPTPLLPPHPPHAPAPAPAKAPPEAGASAFARLVHGLSREADRGEATVRGALDAARGGVAMDAGHLLALQAGIYRYAETMDLAGQIVDKASTGLKTVVQGQ
jgi:hypothetical protein